MDLGIAGRTAIVCASTGGLGEATARALATEGANVVVSGRRGERARKIAAELPSAVGVEADIVATQGPDGLFAAATDAFGTVDILVLNGPGPSLGSAAGATPEDLTLGIETLLRPHLRLVSLALPGMRARAWGRILAIGSSGIVAPLPNLALSNLGRAALASYLKTLASEVATDGVTVNLVVPGRIATERVAQLDAKTAERTRRSIAEVEAESRKAIPVGRYGEPTEFGAVAAFLCSQPASYVTGTAVRCDGGFLRNL